MTGPRANFACLSPKCRGPEGQAPQYELPVGATRCPVCGSKRLQRLFDSVNVITKGVSAFTDRVVEPAWNEAARASDLRRQADAAVAAGRVEEARVLQPAQATAHLAALGVAPGKGSLVSRPAHPVQLELKRNTLRPAPTSLVDREYTVVRGRDGRAEMAKA